MSDLLNSASLVMIPSGYKEDVVYSAIPTNGNGDLSFTRASNGTRINSAGLVEVVPWNFVEQSSNLGSWSNAGVTITTGITDAYGTTNAITMSNISSGSNSDYIVKYSNAMALPTGTQINYSVYLKGSGTIGVIIERSVSGDYFYQQQGVTLSSTWTRYDFAYTIGVGVNANGISFYVSNLSGTTATSVDICFPQINYGSTAKPYFPTTDRLNVPRLTYQNGGVGCPSLLLEKQSTNLAFPSEDLTAWTAGGMTNTSNITTSPDGTQNADKSTIGSTTRYYDVVTNVITTVSGTIYTTSFFAKKGTGIEAIYFFQGDGVRIAKWNLNNGAYIGHAPSDGYNAFTSYSSESLGNGWYRFTATYTASPTGGNLTIGISTNTNDSVTPISGNGTDFVYVWGLQYEASSYPTSYIPTTSSSATRVADACFKTGISSLIGQTEGVAFVDFDFNGNYSSGGIITICLDGGAGNELYIWVQTSGLLLCEVANSGSVQASITGAVGSIGRKKIAFAYKQNDFVVYLNGTQVGTDTSGTVPIMSRLYVGKYWANDTYNLNAGVNQAVIFTTRLTNAELASLTTI